MATRNSDYEREERDAYYTPAEVIDCVVKKAVLPGVMWDPCEGKGAVRDRLSHWGFICYGSDIETGPDFLETPTLPMPDVRGIVTNPPFNVAEDMIWHALGLLKPVQGLLALLLPSVFDHGRTKRHLFELCPQFTGQIKLQKRIVWFWPKDGSTPHPSEWHSWFVWNWRNLREPWVRYDKWPD